MNFGHLQTAEPLPLCSRRRSTAAPARLSPQQCPLLPPTLCFTQLPSTCHRFSQQ